MDVQEKLEILADAAKYDVACTSSGLQRGSKAGYVGNALGARMLPQLHARWAVHFVAQGSHDQRMRIRLRVLR